MHIDQTTNDRLTTELTALRQRVAQLEHVEAHYNQLRDDEGRYRAIYDHTPVMMHSIDPQGRLVNVNSYWLKVLGYERDEVIGRKSVEFLTEASRQLAVEVAIPKAMKTGEVRDVEYQMVKKNGEVIDVVLSATVEADESGEMTAGRVLVVDITDRKRVEAARRESEERYRALYDRTPVMMHSIDHNGRVVSVNEHWLATLGYDYDEVIGKVVFDFYTEASARYAKENAFQEFLANGMIKDKPIQLVKKNGEIMDCLLSAHGQWNERGELVRTMAFLVDVTERKRAEEALQQARDELELRVEQRTLELSRANAALKDEVRERRRAEESLHRYASRLEALRGIDRAILAARSSEAIAHSALRHIRQLVPFVRASVVLLDFEAGHGIVQAILAQGQTSFGIGDRVPLEPFGDIAKLREGCVHQVDDAQALPQTRFVKQIAAEGARCWINVPLTAESELIGALNLASGKPGAFSKEHIEIAQEVANSVAIAIRQAQLHEKVERHSTDLERRVAERTADLEAFSYSVSHDLRTPLRAIYGFSRILLDDYANELDDEGRRLLSVICGNTQTMGQLIDDLLAFSRLGQQDLVSARIDMSEVAQSAFDELQGVNLSCRQHLELHTLPPAFGDPALIRQVFINLLSNAIKFTRHRDTPIIEIGHRVVQDHSVYYIRDNGVGFDNQYAHKLFGVFERLHRATEFEGTGVGLAIVQRIIQRHGGRVWAEGKIDEGAVIFFTLPRKPSTSW